MAQKRNEGRVDCLEKEVGEIREEMQRLPGMEKTVMDLAQNVMRVLQSLKETQKAVAALSSERDTTTAAQREDRARWIPGVGEPSGGGWYRMRRGEAEMENGAAADKWRCLYLRERTRTAGSFGPINTSRRTDSRKKRN